MKIGVIFVDTFECYLGKTIDNNLIVFDRQIENEPKLKVIYKIGKPG